MPPKLIAKLKNSKPPNPSTHKLHLPRPNRNRHLPISIHAAPNLLAGRTALKRRVYHREPAKLTNLKHGSLTVEVIKYGGDWGIYNMSGRPVGAYTHALPVFALPVYYALSAVAHTYYHQPATVLHPRLAPCGFCTDILLLLCASSSPSSTAYSSRYLMANVCMGFVAALIALIGTSFPLWAVTGKDHFVSLLFIMRGT